MNINSFKNDKKSYTKSLSLKKNVSWTILGNAIFSGTQWAILISLARLGSVEMVGTYALAIAIVTPVMMLTNLQLRVVQATDINDEYHFSDYLGLRIMMSIFSLVLTSMIVSFTSYSLETIVVILVICAVKIIESISDVVYGLLQKKETMNYIAKSKIYRGVLSLASISIFLWLVDNLTIALLSMLVVGLLVFLFYDLQKLKERSVLRSDFIPRFNLKTFIEIVKISLPLGFVLMMGSLNNNIPRYFIEYHYNEEALGYFAAMVYLIVTGNTFMGALGQAASPRLSKLYAEGNKKQFSILTLKMTVIGSFVGLIGLIVSILFGSELLTLIYGKEYAEYTNVFIVLMIAGTILYTGSFIGYSVTAARFFKIQPVIGMIWLIASLVSSIIFIPEYGLIGAAYVIVFTSIIQLITKVLVILYVINSFENNVN